MSSEGRFSDRLLGWRQSILIVGLLVVPVHDTGQQQSHIEVTTALMQPGRLLTSIHMARDFRDGH